MADDQQAFHAKDRVEAVEDELPGVPAGTLGTIVEVSGLTWIRYRIDFDNGKTVNLVDGHHLRGIGED
jgi:hypothetical protein